MQTLKQNLFLVQEVLSCTRKGFLHKKVSFLYKEDRSSWNLHNFTWNLRDQGNLPSLGLAFVPLVTQHGSCHAESDDFTPCIFLTRVISCTWVMEGASCFLMRPCMPKEEMGPQWHFEGRRLARQVGVLVIFHPTARFQEFQPIARVSPNY